MAETAMMACNRYRLRTLAQSHHRGAQLALALLGKTDRLLGTILLGNTLVNAASATLAGLITVQLFGDEKWALGIGTLVISFLILVFAEIMPKVVAAAYADQLAVVISFALVPILRISAPLVAMVNGLANGILGVVRLRRTQSDEMHVLSPAELRTVLLESAHSIPPQHRAILLNLFDLEAITVDDIMTPRGSMETINLQDGMDEIRQQIATGFHTRTPVCDGDPGNIIGILHQRRLLAPTLEKEFTREALLEQLSDPYFIPSGTQVYAQLQFFRENRQRLGLVVDEYGEILGLVTLEDIIEEIIGKFTTSMPGVTETLRWGEEGSVLVGGTRALRELNRDLGLDLPLEGPKTLNGLLLEHFQDIPESGVSARIGGVAMEIVQTQDKAVRMVRLFRPID